MHGYNLFTGPTPTSSKIDIYYNNGAGFEQQSNAYTGVLSGTPAIYADLNGDGQADMMSTNGIYGGIETFSFRPVSQERLLQKITNGHNYTIQFTHAQLTSASAGYTRGPSVGTDVSNVRVPLNVVTMVQMPDGAGTTAGNSFMYEEAKMHRGGRGLIGFKKFTTFSWPQETKVEQYFGYSNHFYVPYLEKVLAYETDPTPAYVLMREQNYVHYFSWLGGKRFFLQQMSASDKNLLNNATSTILHTYDTYGNVTVKDVHLTRIGYTSPYHQTTTTARYVASGPSAIPAHPSTVTVSNTSLGKPTLSRTTDYTYSNGLLSATLNDPGTPGAMLTAIYRDDFSNPHQVVGNGITATMPNRINTYDYDAKGRFPVEHLNALWQPSYTSYDSRWGAPISKTSVDGITTTFEYDAFGRLSKTNLPAGYSITNSHFWSAAPPYVYTSVTSDPHGPDKVTAHDLLGRMIESSVEGTLDPAMPTIPRRSTTTTVYNAEGQVVSTTAPHYAGETPLTTTYGYDYLGRAISSSNALSSTTTSYSYGVLGRLSTATLNSAGQTKRTMQDIAGRVLTSGDDAGTVSFEYDSEGKVTKTTGNGTTTTEYDDYGRRKKITEPNAGTVEYTYTHWGQVQTQTDAAGNTSTWNYDVLGRSTNRTGPEGTTTYAYYGSGLTGKTGRLQTVTGFNGNNQSYDYDALGRVSSSTETIDGVNYTVFQGYNAAGQPTGSVYPAGMSVVRNYDAAGYPEKISWSAAGTGVWTDLFDRVDQNARGQITKYQLGNGLPVDLTYNHGFPINRATPGVQNYTLEYDYPSGNITKRIDGIKGLEERFTYDLVTGLRYRRFLASRLSSRAMPPLLAMATRRWATSTARPTPGRMSTKQTKFTR